MEIMFSGWDGGPDVLSQVSRPMPVPNANQVFVRIYSSAVSRADCLMVAG